MDSSELLVLCSSQPGFLRSLGGKLAGKCRLLECYSLAEAAQMVQLHQPHIALVDLRKADTQRFNRSWAMAHNSETTYLVVVTNLSELDSSQIPAELSNRVIHVEVDNSSPNFDSAVAAVESVMSRNVPLVSQPAAASLPQDRNLPTIA